MIQFILNNELIQTTAPAGMALLDFIRKEQFLTGTKLVCKEGECGACTVLVGDRQEGVMRYQSMTSCITPLVNANGKHIVTVEGLNGDKLTPVQAAMANNYGTQCGFCTPGFVVSLTGFLLSGMELTQASIIQFIDGNICRCTGYKSIERAAATLLEQLKEIAGGLTTTTLVENGFLPTYFKDIEKRLVAIKPDVAKLENGIQLGGGSDLYVQRPYEMYETTPIGVFDHPKLNAIKVENGKCTFGASRTMGDLQRSTIFKQALPDSDYIFKLLSSTQIRNMATIGGNLVNASPIGDFTVLLLALDSTITLESAGYERRMKLRDFYHSYKVTDLKEGEILTQIEFDVPGDSTYVHFEKVSQRKYLDIASVNLASSITIDTDREILSIHLAVGGVGPIPLYLKSTTQFLKGKKVGEGVIYESILVMNDELSPISDARGSAEYKRLLARQLLIAQFMNLDPSIYRLNKLIGA